MARKTAAITAQNTFTDPISLQSKEMASISISGTFSATVTVQRELEGGTWLDVETYTSAVEKNYTSGSNESIRVGVKTSDYTSGTVNVVVQGGHDSV